MRRIFIRASLVVSILSLTAVAQSHAQSQGFWTRVKLQCAQSTKVSATVTVRKDAKPISGGTAELTCGSAKHTFQTGLKPNNWEAEITVTNTQTGNTETCKLSGRFKAGVRCGSPSVGLILEKPFLKNDLKGFDAGLLP